jgi:hypothetical protein
MSHQTSSTGFLTTEETKAIIMAVIRGHPDQGVSRDQIERAVEWAEGVRVESALLQSVLAGQVVISGFDEDGDLRFSAREGGSA